MKRKKKWSKWYNIILMNTTHLQNFTKNLMQKIILVENVNQTLKNKTKHVWEFVASTPNKVDQ